MKRWFLMEVPEEIGMVKVQYFKRSDDLVFYENSREFKGNDFLEGPVEFMQAAFKTAGVVLETPKKGDLFLNRLVEWEKAGRDFVGSGKWLVIPADPATCPNCQNVKPGDWATYIYGGQPFKSCLACGRPESEWTYAKDPADNPEWWIGGVL